MKPPKRMCEDPAAPAELRADLSRAHEAAQHYQLKPDALRAAIAADALTAGEHDPSHEVQGLAESGASRLWRFKSWPWGWKLALLGALGGGGAALGSSALTVSSRPPTATLPAPAASADAPAVADLPKQSEGAARGAPDGAPLREVDQLVKIRTLLQDDPEAAYHLASELEQKFPGGALSEEREALALLALAKMGRDEEARRRARIFLARHPESTMRGTVQRVLKQ